MRFLTILTPTYNRGECLKKLYESLKGQNNKNFVWYVADDGSTDDTKNIIKTFQAEQQIEIRYEYKKNGGKHTAINFAAKNITTPLTIIVDSDDVLIPDATDTIYQDWVEYGERPNFGGLNYLRGYSATTPIGDRWPEEEQYANTITLTYNQKIKGDKAEVICTKVLQEIPFPEFEGERFLSECFLWVGMAQKYNMFMRNKIIYVTEYLEGGLTKSGRTLQVNSPRGAMENAKIFLDSKFSPFLICKNAILYNCYGFFCGISIKRLQKNSPKPFYTGITLLPGYFLYLHWKKYLNKK